MRNPRSLTVLAGAILGLGTLATSAHGGLLMSFENSDDVSGAWGWSGEVTASRATLGVTDGSFSMKVASSANNAVLWTGLDEAQFYPPNALFQVDITVFPADVTPNGDGDRVMTIAPTLALNPSNETEPALNLIIDGLKHTYSWTYTPPTGMGYSQLHLATTASGPATFYIDNIRTSPVPEPTSLSLLGLTAVSLLRRRRA